MVDSIIGWIYIGPQLIFITSECGDNILIDGVLVPDDRTYRTSSFEGPIKCLKEAFPQGIAILNAWCWRKILVIIVEYDIGDYGKVEPSY
jgi:hypothetical protein